jgi:hypothetical protein
MTTITHIFTRQIEMDLMSMRSFDEVAEKYNLSHDALMDMLIALFVKLGEQGKLVDFTYDDDRGDYDWQA